MPIHYLHKGVIMGREEMSRTRRATRQEPGRWDSAWWPRAGRSSRPTTEDQYRFQSQILCRLGRLLGRHIPACLPDKYGRSCAVPGRAQAGAFFRIRLNVDHDARGLMPFVVRFREGWTNAQGFRSYAPGQFDLAVHYIDEGRCCMARCGR